MPTIPSHALTPLSHALRRLALVLALVLASCSGGASSLEEIASSSLAQLDGSLDVPGLQAPVEVIRDEYGVPHIYAENEEDLFFAQGYVMAQDRLWQMEMWRRWHEGRLAEIFGAEALPYDRRTRLMMYRGPFDDTEWTSYHPNAEALFTAHANGVNAFVEQNRDNLPLEFQLTGVEPLPWTKETVVLRWAALAVPSVRGHAINEVQLAMDVARFGAEEANRRFAPDPWDDLQVPDGLDVSLFTDEMLAAMRAGDGDPFVTGRLPALEVLPEYRDAMPPMQVAQVLTRDIATEGSNNWVMSGAMSPTGVPILANDPHRRIEMPALRYYVHLNAPGWNIIGGGEPPFAGTDAGNNEHIAWGFTFAGTDMVDVFVEETNPDDPNQTLYRGEWEEMEVIEELIAVKGQAPERVTLKFTRHGPVFYEDPENNKAYSVQSVVRFPGTAAYKGSFQLAQAESCEDFFERANHWLVPTHSLICGDDSGNIALQVTGLTPNRVGWNGRLPVPGTGEYEWDGFREDLPREFNPERGYIATANNNVHPPGYTDTSRPVFYHTLRGKETSRIMRLHDIFGSGGTFSIEDHKAVQWDNHILAAARDIPMFEGWTSADPDVEWARAAIAGWDGDLDRESLAAALYRRWTDGVDRAGVDDATSAADRQEQIEIGLAAAIQRLTGELGEDRDEWRYGRLHVSPLPHMFASTFDLPTIERPGGFGSVNATGANFRRIIDLSNIDNSVASNAPGQSAQPGSPFYGNLAEALGNGEYFPLLFSREQVEGGAAHRLMLNPGG